MAKDTVTPKRRRRSANSVLEHLVGVGHSLALMHQLKPGVDRECLYEAPDIGDVFVNTPSIGPVAPSRVTQFVDRAQELCAVRGLDAVFHHHENWPLVILDFSRDCRRAPVRRGGEIDSNPGLKPPAPSQRMPTTTPAAATK
jgi:hypothetical protein